MPPRRNKIHRYGFHFGLFLINNALFELLLRSSQMLFIESMHARHLGLLNQIKVSKSLSFFFTVALLDLGGYWIHRLHHKISFLWKLHVVHHSDPSMDASTGLRNHFGQYLSTFILQFPLLLLVGPSSEGFFAYSLVLFLAVLFHHSNFEFQFKGVEGILVTPNFHRTHHSVISEYHHSNYSGIFVLWDRLFSTFKPSSKGDAPLGTDEPRPFSLRHIFALPLLCFFLTMGCTKQKSPSYSKEFLREVEYGKELIVHTAKYLGPRGSVARVTRSRMNCQNCHLDAGKKPYGISLETAFTRYPEYRAREGVVLTLEDRINHCFERPMNGRPLPSSSRELKAIVSYFRHLSQGHRIGDPKIGDRLNDIVEFPKRAADPIKGKAVFKAQCISCHGENGLGKLDEKLVEFIYPPLWGPESFNAASNMHRVIKLASFVRANMPFGATWDKPILSNEEAFDVAAFINDEKLHPRPKSRWKDYPKIYEKPIDFPSGPFADSFPDSVHKFGPFPEIIEFLRKNNRVAYY